MSSSWMTSSTASPRPYPEPGGAIPNNRVSETRLNRRSPHAMFRCNDHGCWDVCTPSKGQSNSLLWLAGNKNDSGPSHRNEDKTINFIRSGDGGRVRNDCKRPKRLPQRNGGAQAKSKTRQRSHFS